MAEKVKCTNCNKPTDMIYCYDCLKRDLAEVRKENAASQQALGEIVRGLSWADKFRGQKSYDDGAKQILLSLQIARNARKGGK